jgi:hypothetical protein
METVFPEHGRSNILIIESFGVTADKIMAKVAQIEPLALEALANLLEDVSPRVLHGSKSVPGVFSGATAATKAAAQICLDKGWLEVTGQLAGKGKTAKPLYRLTAAGFQAVLARGNPAEILKKLDACLDRLARDTATLPNMIQEKFAEVTNQVAALHQSLQSTSNELRMALIQTETRLKPPDLETLQRLFAGNSYVPPSSGISAQDWSEDVIRLAGEQKKRDPFQRLTLPQVFDHLRGKFPGLTLGQFHDGLRRLQDERRIRLGPFTQALATLDDPRNALFLDREVKYYVELA